MKSWNEQVDMSTIIVADAISNYLKQQGYSLTFEATKYRDIGRQICGVVFPVHASTAWNTISFISFQIEVEKTVIKAWKHDSTDGIIVNACTPDSFTKVGDWLWSQLPFYAKLAVWRKRTNGSEEDKR
jgi:hypothetical protein